MLMLDKIGLDIFSAPISSAGKLRGYSSNEVSNSPGWLLSDRHRPIDIGKTKTERRSIATC